MDNKPSRGRDFDFGGGDRATRGMSTSVEVSVSALENLFSEIEGAIDLSGDSTPSGAESSTTHCHDPYSLFGRGSPSSVVVLLPILAFTWSVIPMQGLARSHTF